MKDEHPTKRSEWNFHVLLVCGGSTVSRGSNPPPVGGDDLNCFILVCGDDSRLAC